MHPMTVKLIVLERAEAVPARGRVEGLQTALAIQAEALRREIPSHVIAAYNQLKADHKEAVVGVFEENCGGCRAPLSKSMLARLNAETEVSRCENCGRFSSSHPLMRNLSGK